MIDAKRKCVKLKYFKNVREHWQLLLIFSHQIINSAIVRVPKCIFDILTLWTLIECSHFLLGELLPRPNFGSRVLWAILIKVEWVWVHPHCLQDMETQDLTQEAWRLTTDSHKHKLCSKPMWFASNLSPLPRLRWRLRRFPLGRRRLRYDQGAPGGLTRHLKSHHFISTRQKVRNCELNCWRMFFFTTHFHFTQPIPDLLLQAINPGTINRDREGYF